MSSHLDKFDENITRMYQTSQKERVDSIQYSFQIGKHIFQVNLSNEESLSHKPIRLRAGPLWPFHHCFRKGILQITSIILQMIRNFTKTSPTNIYTSKVFYEMPNNYNCLVIKATLLFECEQEAPHHQDFKT